MDNSGNRADAAGRGAARVPDPGPDGLLSALVSPPGDPASPILVATSGGLDSTVLLAASVEAFGAGRVIAAHVDHALQAESAAWAEHCHQQAEALGVRYAQRRLEPPRRFADGLEAWARQARYDALAVLASESGAGAIALAHHRDDQIETVLLNLARGAGPAGAVGMRPVSRRGAILLWRPFLGFEREHLRAFADARRLHWLEDPSNRDPRLRRNAVRHRVLPVLEAELPGFGVSLLRHAGLCGELDELAHELLAVAGPAVGGPAVADDGSGIGRASLDRRSLRTVSATEQALTLRRWLRDAGLRMPSLSATAEMRRQLIVSESAYGRVDFDGCCLRRYRDRIEILPAGPRGRRPRPDAADGPSVHWQWAGERRFELPAFDGALIIEPAVNGRGLSAARLAAEPLWVRSLAGGARIRPRVGGPSRRLKLLCQERGLAVWERRGLPMLVDVAGNVVHVPGLASDGAWQAVSDAEPALDVRFEPL